MTTEHILQISYTFTVKSLESFTITTEHILQVYTNVTVIN